MALQAALKTIAPVRPTLRMMHISSLRNGLPTDFFQKSLPHLSIPSLEKTLASFMDIKEATLEPEEFKELKKLANSFLQGNGKTLQKQLIDYYNEGDLTLYGGYRSINSMLRRKDPVIYQSGGCGISDLGKEELQLVRSSKLIHSVAKVAMSLRDKTFQPNVLNYNPVFDSVLKETEENCRTQVANGLGMIPNSMEAHPTMFGSSRIPDLRIDGFRRSDTSQNVVIIRNGHLFSFDVISKNDEIMDVNEIFTTLTKIKEQSAVPSPFPIASLTFLDRTSWAKHRNHLLTDQHNSELLKVLEESVAVFTLDGQFERKGIEKDIYLGKNVGDRWFDKGAFYSIDEDSPYTGLATNSVECNAVVTTDNWYAVKKQYEKIESLPVTITPESPAFKHLQFNIDDYTASGIKEAETVFTKFKREFHYESFEIPYLTNTEFKKRFLNPSSMIQLALQISFIKMYGKPQVTTAVTLLPTIINGHVQYHKSPLPIMASLAKTFVQEKTMDMSLLRKYCDVYYSKILQMRMGLDFYDEHLFSLEQLSLKLGYNCDFFGNELYQRQKLGSIYVVTIPHKIIKNILYTSSKDAFGMSYLFGKNGMSGNLSSFDSPDSAPIKELAKHFLETIDELINYISIQK